VWLPEPGPNFPNAKLRTDPGSLVASSGQMRPTHYLKELSRLVVSHS
jgi:hypothetical protein